MTRSAVRPRRFGGVLLLALTTTLLLTLAFSGVALAETFRADQLADLQDSEPGDGRCDASSEPGDQCTLRAALQESNALDGRDTVVLIEGTYLLTLPGLDTNGDGFPDAEQRAATGDLDIKDETTVRGAGLNDTTVQNAVNDRHFHVQRRLTSATISGLTLTNGNGVDGTNSGRGGGILNMSTLLLEEVALRQNRGLFGGAIDNRGTLTMKGTTVDDNEGVFGGGLYNEGQLRITDSTISNNAANRGIADNGGLGGGLYNTANASLTNTTIASNTAQERGGGLYNVFGDARLLNVTINQNGSSEGASVANTSGRTYLENTIVANGTGGRNCDGARTISRGNNLADDRSCNLDERGDREGGDPLLSPIPDDDDPLAQIFRPGPGSPAIDAGDDGACPALDQRALERPKDGDGDGAPLCDVGSVEARPQGS
ncbi:MAG: hypothetical protein M3P70_06170 [Actinomycetota bacterium]|nr:hypothetical protein [Actinomycetota bacterium]